MSAPSFTPGEPTPDGATPPQRPSPSPSPHARPRPLADLPATEARRIAGVFTDIDDTLTTDGAITPDALAALHRLAAAGLPVVAITGRPSGWSEPFAREWPVAAIVAENGAVALMRDASAANGLRIEFAQDEATRARNAPRLRAAAARVLREVPGAALARDSAGRLTDIAIDHAEFNRLDDAAIAQVLALLHADGLNASVSSIHVNAWFGDHGKRSGARWIVQRLFGRALDAETDRWAFVGDSTNDQQLFGWLPTSVGVANLLRFEAHLRTWPAYLARHERGAGFSEFVDALLAKR